MPRAAAARALGLGVDLREAGGRRRQQLVALRVVAEHLEEVDSPELAGQAQAAHVSRLD